ncbi:CDP-glycerol glycerophosphotransferase family protein [Microbacterium sp. cx-59]|uniref:CDP-glycerol glycerophosphotransferase family protein n=1 Tax=Microbacterium sp. cx-59 TaxID=2891207 RepID=UPI001E351DD2|nr:CDP-glycerol glycerophosphotransferase family protein [Microbacterium sp. cx-59]MCC4906903.1 CDP-glycerol glycerophosphotransferase family protein [Microbacterium sp. cx-59]
MASFSFGDGNARKLLAIPLYAAARVITAVVPRSADEWVFGCAVGIADGALAVWDEAHAAGARAVWLVDGPDQAREAARRGIPAVRKTSLRGFWRTARARVVIVTHGFGDVNRYAVSGAFIAQLWHGIPLKRIGIDSPATVRSSILPSSRLVRAGLAAMYRSATRRITLLPAASHLVRGRLESAFSLPDSRVRVLGEPRVDVLSRGTADERRTRARARIVDLTGADADAALILYAPTWRDGDLDPAIPSATEWTAIEQTLAARDAVLLVRSHPLGAGEYRPSAPSGRIRMLGSDVVNDVTPLLPGLDLLVTDYSSLAFDASLVPLPVVFFAPDVDTYAEQRGFYGTYRDVAGDDWATTWTETLAQIEATLLDPTERLTRSRTLDARVHAYRDGRNAQRVYRAIVDSIDPKAGRERSGEDTE